MEWKCKSTCLQLSYVKMIKRQSENVHYTQCLAKAAQRILKIGRVEIFQKG